MLLLHRYLLILACGLFKFAVSQHKICVYMRDCQDVYKLLKLPNAQEEINKIVCKSDKRYPKVWCSVQCGSSSSTGYCSLEHECTSVINSTLSHTCQLKSSNRYVCCSTKTSPIIESTTQTITTTVAPITTTSDTTTETKTQPTIESRHTGDLECGIQSDEDKIAGGSIAGIAEHPWMALLQYKEKGKLVTKCGGVLINHKFVLTAAHCVDTRIELVNVIFGEYNISSPIDCIQNYCIPRPEVVGIKRTIIHPAWTSAERQFYDDIALIELKQEVKYTEFIRPICLSSQSMDDTSREKLTVAGWGYTENKKSSDVKRKVVIEMQPRVLCLNTVRIPLRESQLCVGGTEKDSCNGDSGGPLMATEYTKKSPIWRLVGIVSLGHGKCGSRGKPGVYTNVPYYIDWIKANIKYFLVSFYYYQFTTYSLARIKKKMLDTVTIHQLYIGKKL